MPKLSDDDQARFEGLIAALCDVEDGLSEWEVTFVDDMSRQIETQHLTDRQRTKIEDLHEKHC